MLVKNQTTEMRWHPHNKQYYIDRGYQYTKMRDAFMVNVEDLPNGSHAKVKVICDYCGKELIKPYKEYIANHDDVLGDCCAQCKDIKFKQTCLDKYGVNNVSKVKEIQNKRIQTFINKYGCKNPFQANECKEKTKQTWLEKYGVEYANQNIDVRNKMLNTLTKRYGVINPGQIPEVKEKVKQTCLKHYGVPYSLQADEVRQSIVQTLYRKGTVPTSKAEQQMCDLLIKMFGNDKCFPNYPLDRINMDCMVNINDSKIDVEYDGWYYHKDKQDYDNRRDIFVQSNGYKVLRIKGNYQIPTEEQLQEAINYLVKGNLYAEIILDI